MKKQFKKVCEKNKKSKKGFSLVEVIVSMALVVIISAMVFSVCNFALARGNQNKQKNFFVTQSQNYVKAYFLGGEDYKKSMAFLTGNEYEFGQNAKIYYSKDFEISNQDDYKYCVDLSFGTTFLVECYDSNNNAIYSYEV